MKLIEAQIYSEGSLFDHVQFYPLYLCCDTISTRRNVPQPADLAYVAGSQVVGSEGERRPSGSSPLDLLCSFSLVIVRWPPPCEILECAKYYPAISSIHPKLSPPEILLLYLFENASHNQRIVDD